MGALGVFNTTEVMNINDKKWTASGDTDHDMNQENVWNMDDSHLRRSSALVNVGTRLFMTGGVSCGGANNEGKYGCKRQATTLEFEPHLADPTLDVWNLGTNFGEELAMKRSSHNVLILPAHYVCPPIGP